MAYANALGEVTFAHANPYVNGVLDRQQIEALRALDPYAQDCWVCWGDRHMNQSGQPKMPIDPATMQVALTGEAALSGPFEVAVDRLEGDWVAGVGIMLKRVTPGTVALDFDHVRNAETGELSKTGAKLLRILEGCYVEVSPSGTGLRAIVCVPDLPQWLIDAKSEKAGKVQVNLAESGPDGKKEKIELFCPGGNAFVRMSGRLVEGHKAQVGGGGAAMELLDWVRNMHRATKPKAGQTFAPLSNPAPAGAGASSNKGKRDVWEQLEVYRGHPGWDVAKIAGLMRDGARKSTSEQFKNALADLKSGQENSEQDFYLYCEIVRRGAGSAADAVEVLHQLAGPGIRDKLKQRKDLQESEPVRAAQAVLQQIESKSEKRDLRNLSKSTWKNLPDAQGGGGGTTTEVEQSAGKNFTRNERGRIANTPGNGAIALSGDETAQGLFRYNLWTRAIEKLRNLQELHPDAERSLGSGIKEVTDVDVVLVKDFLSTKYGIQLDTGEAWEALTLASLKNQVDPLVDGFEALPAWDGVERVKTWLVDYWKVDDRGIEDYVSLAGQCFLVGAVNRAFEPGCKFDTALVIEGLLGAKKSSAFEVLADQIGKGLFTDQLQDVSDPKHIIEQTKGRFIVELAELAAVVRAKDAEPLKKALSANSDDARLSYDRATSKVPRRFVFVGTTNRSEYLSDGTGALARRIFPMRSLASGANQVDIQGLKLDGKQLWAEALHLYRKGALTYIRESEDARATYQWEKERQKRCIEGLYEEEARVAAYKIVKTPQLIGGLRAGGQVTVREAAEIAGIENLDSRSLGAFAKAMEHAGFVKARKLNGYQLYDVSPEMRQKILFGKED